MIVGALTCTLALCGALGLAGCDASDGESASTTSGMASSTADADKDSSLAGAVRQAATEQDRADSQKEAQAVQQAIEAVTASYGTSVSVAYLPVGDADGAVYINGDTQRSSASMIKLIVLATLLDKAAAGEVDLDAEVKVRSEDIVAGTGTVQEDGPGAYQLRELARRMIADSDNTATNVIVDLIGMDAVNAIDIQRPRAAEAGDLRRRAAQLGPQARFIQDPPAGLRRRLAAERKEIGKHGHLLPLHRMPRRADSAQTSRNLIFIQKKFIFILDISARAGIIKHVMREAAADISRARIRRGPGV